LKFLDVEVAHKISNVHLEQELGLIMLKKNVIMYADDTALLAESASNLQNTLNLIQEYCIKWKLKVNIDFNINTNGISS
jgi:hypothetical protein